MQRLACLLISSAATSTPTSAMEMLLDVIPIEEFIMAEAVRGSYRVERVGLWTDKAIGTTGKTKSHVDICNRARQELDLLGMPADRCKKTRMFERKFKCRIEERKEAVEWERNLDKSPVRCYTDGSKYNDLVGAGAYIVHPHQTRTEHKSYFLGKLATVFQAEVFAIEQVAERLLEEEVCGKEIVVLSDSQAAIKAIQNTVVQSNTVQRCITNLSKLGESNRVTVTWIPGHAGIQGNEAADHLAKQGTELSIEGPEPFISVPYATCTREIKGWMNKRWETSWKKSKSCQKTKEYVGWGSPSLRRKPKFGQEGN